MIAVLKTEPIEGLTAQERDRLQQLETVIQTGLQTFIEVGNALIEIRESRLYRESGTFENYFKMRWGFQKAQAYRLMEAAEVVADLKRSPIGDLPLPTNEAQCRELAKAEPEKRPEVWEETVRRTDGKPTAKVAREVVEELHPAQRYTVPLFKRADLTEAERNLRDELEYTDDVTCPTWEQLRPLWEQFGEFMSVQTAKEEGIVSFGVLPQVTYVVSRPDLNGNGVFPIHLDTREHAWHRYQREREKYLAMLERKPMSPVFQSVEPSEEMPRSEKSERVENDYYPTPPAITQALINLGVISGQVFEPCAGSGDIAKLFDGFIANEPFPQPGFEPCLTGDATDPELWKALDEMGGCDWTVTNPPYGMELPTKILELAAQHSREGVAMLLRLGFIEPCQERRELLQKLSDHLRYFIPINPRPQFRKDITGTDSITVAWYVWDFTWSWEDQGIDCPFKFITDWRSAA